MSGGRGGRRAGAGRPKGRLNKETADIKEMVVGALCAVGGADYLARQAERNPVAFMGLIGRVLPLQVTGENGGALLIDFRWADAPAPLVTDETTSTSPLVTAETTIESEAVDVTFIEER